MNKKFKKLYSACFDSEAYPFHSMAGEVEVVRDPAKMTEPDSVLVVWGGSDINPELYGHAKSKTTHFNDARDTIEWGCIQQAIKLGIPMIGVCRGAQMMCAAAGGWLFQDVSNHAGYNHNVNTIDGTTLKVNSIHHQMMGGLDKVDHVLLAWSDYNRSATYIWKNDIEYKPNGLFKEPEMVYFPKIKAIAVQWHPEMLSDREPSTTFLFEKFYECTKETTEA